MTVSKLDRFSSKLFAGTAGACVLLASATALAAGPEAGAEVGADSAAGGESDSSDRGPENFGAFLNPLGVLFNAYLAEFDVRISDRMAVAANAQYISIDVLGVESTGIGAGIGAQIFFQDKAFEGFYATPSLQYQRVTVEVPGSELFGVAVPAVESDYTAFGPRVVGGYQWNFHPLSLRAGIGGTYWLSSQEDVELEGLALDVDGAVGLVF